MGAGVVGEDAVGEGIVGEEVVVVGEGVVGTVGTGVGSEGAVSQGVVGEDVVGEDSRRGRTFRLPEQQIYPPSPPERGSGGEKRRAPFLPPRVPRALMCEVRRRRGGGWDEKRRAPFPPPHVPRALMCEVRRRGGCLAWEECVTGRWRTWARMRWVALPVHA